jgi:orotidine-5'-phosphate decarboxylase
MTRFANTAARVSAVLSNGVDRLTVHSLDGGQRSEGVSVHVEKMMNPTVRAVTVGSSVLDGAGSLGSDVVLIGRKVLTVGLRPGAKVQGEVGIADEAVETRNLAGN